MSYRKTHNELEVGDLLYFGNKEKVWHEVITDKSVNDGFMTIQTETEILKILVAISGEKSYGWIHTRELELVATSQEEVEEKLKIFFG